MTDGVMIPLDVDDTRARTKVARLKKEAGQAGKAFGQAGAQAARVGGAAGGALGRGIGGFSQGVGAGFLGLGLAGGGMYLSSFLQRDGERQTMAREREGRMQARAADARTVMERADQRAAGGLKFLSQARRIISSGADRNRVAQAITGGKQAGLGAAESLAVMEAADLTGLSMLDIQTGLATGMVGEDAASVAGNIQKYGGLQNAIAANRNMGMDEAGKVISRTLTDTRSGKLARAGAAMSPVEQAQLDALMSGETARVLERQAQDELNPGAKLALQASEKVMESVNLLRAAAEAESGVAALLKEMGRVVGLSEGSAARQLAVGAAAAME